MNLILYFLLWPSNLLAQTPCARAISGSPWVSYEQAKTLLEPLNLRSRVHFLAERRTSRLPERIPSHPEDTYGEDWRGWGDFLSTGNVARKPFIPYLEAKALLEPLGLRSKEHFLQERRAGHVPEEIPSNPARTYREDWKGWGRFLSTGNVRNIEVIDYERAQRYVIAEGIKTCEDFRKWSCSGLRPKFIPSNPRSKYKKWRGWKEFLQTTKARPWMGKRRAQAYLKEIGVTSILELEEFLQSDQRPPEFPPSPQKVYKPWKGPAEFLGIKWPSFREVRAHIRFLGLTTIEEYHKERRLSGLMNIFPPNPAEVYSKRWKGWDHFLSLD